MIGFLDDIFCRLEGKPTKKKPTAKKVSKVPKGEGLGSLLYKLFVSKEYQDKGLSGWKDDKEKFKIDLINDIKDFLFTKWEKPWVAGLIFDEKGKVVSGFRNIYGRVFKEQGNVLGLERNKGESPYFITLNKVTELKATVLDRSKFTTILSYIPIFKDKGKASEKPDYMLPKFHSVINIDFVEGIKKPTFKVTEFKNLELNEYVERFIEQLKHKGRIPKLIYDQADRAYYTHSQTSWVNDSIHLAPIKQFKNIEGYYSVLFHEITHSTMNPTRCGRGKNGKKVGLSYANEELVAEMGAMIVCSELGLKYNRQNSITYLKGWLRNASGTTDDALVEAYAYACDAAQYLLDGVDFESLVPKTMIKRTEGEALEVEPKKCKNPAKDTLPVEEISSNTEPTLIELACDPKVEVRKIVDTQTSLFGVGSAIDQKGYCGLKGINRVKKAKTYSIGGEVGKFLGRYERQNYSIVLRGDKGAGKSRFLYQLMDAFATKMHRVAFISLEMGSGSSVSQSYRNAYIKPENQKRIDITDQPLSYDELDAICKMYEVVAVDSWTKLRGLRQMDFDRLQKANPRTILIAIFQSTTGKVTRGGNMPEFDAAIVIHVHAGGVAECEKNRYAATDRRFSVFDKRVIKEEQAEEESAK